MTVTRHIGETAKRDSSPCHRSQRSTTRVMDARKRRGCPVLNNWNDTICIRNTFQDNFPPKNVLFYCQCHVCVIRIGRKTCCYSIAGSVFSSAKVGIFFCRHLVHHKRQPQEPITPHSLFLLIINFNNGGGGEGGNWPKKRGEEEKARAIYTWKRKYFLNFLVEDTVRVHCAVA